MINEIKKMVREVTENDTELPKISYSAIDMYINCPYNYKNKYIDAKRTDVTTLPLELGTLCHLVLELKGQYILNNNPVDYNRLLDIFTKGYDEITEKTQEHIAGIEELKNKYWELWGVSDNKSGMNYTEKTRIFSDIVLPTRIEEKEWEILDTEVHFEFVYKDKIIMHGFIDRVDKNKTTEELRITDYKTSKAVFPDEKIKTPLQHIFYDLACVYLYGKLPVEHVYDFILLNQIQDSNNGVCSKGYLKRGIAKIDKTLDLIINKKDFKPKPTPLCYWCAYHTDSPNADKIYKGECHYHSLWTPENKTYEVLNKYEEGRNNNKRICNFDF